MRLDLDLLTYLSDLDVKCHARGAAFFLLFFNLRFSSLALLSRSRIKKQQEELDALCSQRYVSYFLSHCCDDLSVGL